jgi:hypothetical protein
MVCIHLYTNSTHKVYIIFYVCLPKVHYTNFVITLYISIFLDARWLCIAHWCKNRLGWWVMELNSTFNDIPFTSLWSVLLVEETGVTGEDHRPAASHWQFLSHNVVSSTPRHDRNLNSPLALIPQVAMNPPTIRPQPHRSPNLKRNHMYNNPMYNNLISVLYYYY